MYSWAKRFNSDGDEDPKQARKGKGYQPSEEQPGICLIQMSVY